MDKEDVVHIYIYVCVCVCVCVYTKEYYSALKNKIMPFAAAWIELEIAPREVREKKTNTI